MELILTSQFECSYISSYYIVVWIVCFDLEVISGYWSINPEQVIKFLKRTGVTIGPGAIGGLKDSLV